MSKILEGSEGHISIIDDMLIHGKTQEEHNCRLKIVLKKLDGAGATLNAEKCEFSKKEVNFAGYVLNEEVRPRKNRVNSGHGHTPECE